MKGDQLPYPQTADNEREYHDIRYIPNTPNFAFPNHNSDCVAVSSGSLPPPARHSVGRVVYRRRGPDRSGIPRH
jgi:hypothetical protein